ncbi:MAG: Ig-like domain-containing protein, partial [Mycetocola sp.]
MSVTAAAVLVAVPVGVALANKGVPVTEPELAARDVWVTNGQDLLVGRVNAQIAEVESAVATRSSTLSLLQDGEDVFVYDRGFSALEQVDTAFATLGARADLPSGAEVSLRDHTLSVVDPEDGRLWISDVSEGLRFSSADDAPRDTVGADAQAAVAAGGDVVVFSPERQELLRYPRDGAEPHAVALPALTNAELTVAGDEAVIVDHDGGQLVRGDGSSMALPDGDFVVQQPGAASDRILLATADALIRVPLDGSDPVVTSAEMAVPATDPGSIAQPVAVGSCDYAAWAQGARALMVCEEREPQRSEFGDSGSATAPVFRVNGVTVVLNDAVAGEVWRGDSAMRLVTDWESVTPPEDESAPDGEQKSATQSFEDTIAERTEQNRPPTARDDTFGVRPGRSTVLLPLANDTDPDGDVLTIERVDDLPEGWGTMTLIDGGRALQFEPEAERTSGEVTLRYSVSDGRPGGTASAEIVLRVVPPEENRAPVQARVGATSVERGQSMSYNALTDWDDPDGDDLYVVSARSLAGDDVRTSPDGLVTVSHSEGALGERVVEVVVSDGRMQSTGTFTVTVEEAGALGPIGAPDFGEGFAGQPVVVEPLDNDLSPSGDQLELRDASAITGGITISVNQDNGTVQATAGTPGSYYVKYSLGAGQRSSVGLIRIDITDRPGDRSAPIAVRDIGFLRPAEPLIIPVLANDQSPDGAVLAVQDLTIPDEALGLSIEVLEGSVVRVTSTAALERSVQFGYTVSDGLNSSEATVTVIPVPPLTVHQPPIVHDDAVTIRAGDVSSVDVLDNDIHPDNAVLHLDEELAEKPAEGVAFVSGDAVRIQAPPQQGEYSLVYRVHDDFGQTATGDIRVTVLPEDAEGNRAPTPRDVTARVFAGASVALSVPLYGVDPDGDSTVLDGVASAPEMGAITDQSSTELVYRASPDAAGTDEFSYRLRDPDGEVGTGTIRIGVVQRPERTLPPVAVDDVVEARPGTTVSVPVLDNDSDPNGYPITLEEKLDDVSEGITAEVDGGRIVVDVPEGEDSYSLRYTVSNGHGGQDTAVLRVTATPE